MKKVFSDYSCDGCLTKSVVEDNYRLPYKWVKITVDFETPPGAGYTSQFDYYYCEGCWKETGDIPRLEKLPKIFQKMFCKYTEK